MRKDRLFILVAGGLFALGAALAGWQVGLGAYSALYEILREANREAILDSKRTLELFRICGWFSGLGLGAFVFWHWHRDGTALQNAALKRWIVFGLIAMGTTHLGYMLLNGVSVEAMVLTAFVSFVAGSMIAATAYGPPPPFASWIGRAAIAALVGFAMLSVSLAFDKRISSLYDTVGQERLVWVKIAFQENAARPDPETIKAELRMPGGNVKCFAIAWEYDQGRQVLPIRCDFTEMTPDRELVVTWPYGPTFILKMPFARNPKPMHDYSNPISAPDGLVYRYRVT